MGSARSRADRGAAGVAGVLAGKREASSGEDAREADDKGDGAACETALNDAERMLTR